MIFLNEPNVLFLKARKVAGTSFEIALSKFAGADDIITPVTPEDERLRRSLGFRGAQNYRKHASEYRVDDLFRILRSRRLEKRFYNHIGAKEARAHMGGNVFDRAHKVAIVRNPFEVAVSLYFFEMNGPGEPMTFDEWVARRRHLLNANDEQYLIDGTEVIDQYIRYENLLEDTLELEKERPQLQGLSNALKEINAKGGIRPKGATTNKVFSEYPDAVQEIYYSSKRIIDRFGYSYE